MEILLKFLSHFAPAVGVALQKVTSAELIILLSDFNAHMDTDDKTWKDVIRRQETLTSTKTKVACYSSVSPTDCA